MQYNGNVLAALVLIAISLRIAIAIRDFVWKQPRLKTYHLVVLLLHSRGSGISNQTQPLQEALSTASRTFIRIRSTGVLDQLPSRDSLDAKTQGDELFDIFTFSHHVDNGVTLTFTKRGRKLFDAVHESWISLLQGAEGLLVEYELSDEWSLNNLLQKLKSCADSTLIVEVSEPLQSLLSRVEFPSCEISRGRTLSSYKLSKNLPSIVNKFRRIVIDTDGKEPIENLQDRLVAAVRTSGLL